MIRRRARHIRMAVIVAVVLAAAATATATFVVRRGGSTPAVAAPSIFKTATVREGNLSGTQSVDGTLELSSTTTVLHRIEGQTATVASTSSSPRAAASTSANLLSPIAATEAFDCPGITTQPSAPPSTPLESTTTLATVSSTPDTTDGSTVPPASDSTTTTTTTVPEEPTTTTTAPEGTVPTTTPCTTDTTAPSGESPATTVATGRAGGGFPTVSGPSAGGTSNGSDGNASSAAVTQTITSIISANTPVLNGGVLYTVDGSPVVDLDGSLPAWRSMSASSSDGADIAQLEAALVALGYDPEHAVSVDAHFDSATRTMVKAWQRGLGMEQSGTVSLGSVVFLPPGTTVATVDKVVGDSVGEGDAMLTVAATNQQVVIAIPSGDEAAVVPGLAVKIGSVDGTVSRLRSANRSGTVSVEAVIVPSEPVQASGNGSTVKVTLTLTEGVDALIVPAEALVSRLDGHYAVEVEAADGSRSWVNVELVGVSGVDIAISGEGIEVGTTVLLPA